MKSIVKWNRKQPSEAEVKQHENFILLLTKLQQENLYRNGKWKMILFWGTVGTAGFTLFLLIF